MATAGPLNLDLDSNRRWAYLTRDLSYVNFEYYPLGSLVTIQLDGLCGPPHSDKL